MFKIYYKNIRKLDARAGTKYSTTFYNGVKLQNKKDCIRFCTDIIEQVEYLCDVSKYTDAIEYFHTPNAKFRQVNKAHRTPLQALLEFRNYLRDKDVSNGVAEAMVDRWNRVFTQFPQKLSRCQIELVEGYKPNQPRTIFNEITE
mgnify:CR=1 FL=1